MKKTATATKVSDRPMSPALMKRAAESASEYSVVVSSVDGEKAGSAWLARCIEIPSAFAHGPTESEAIETLRGRLQFLVAFMLEEGRKLPSPMKEGKRDAQVNVKLTAEEQMVVKEAAKKRGFKGLSDFFRFAALEYARG